MSDDSFRNELDALLLDDTSTKKIVSDVSKDMDDKKCTSIYWLFVMACFSTLCILCMQNVDFGVGVSPDLVHEMDPLSIIDGYDVVANKIVHDRLLQLKGIADVLRWSNAMEMVTSDTTGLYTGIMFNGIGETKSVNERVILHDWGMESGGKGVLEIDVIPPGGGSSLLRTRFSTILAGEKSNITDSIHSLIIGGSGNSLHGVRNVVLVNTIDRSIHRHGEDTNMYVDNTVYMDSIDVAGGIRTVENAIDRWNEGVAPDHGTGDSNGVLAYYIKPTDYLITVDRAAAASTASDGLRPHRMEVILPHEQAMISNQQLVISIIDVAPASFSTGQRYPENRRHDILLPPVFVTCTRNRTLENELVASIAAELANRLPHDTKEGVVNNEDGVYVSCIGPHHHINPIYRRTSVIHTIPSSSTKEPMQIQVPIFLQEIHMDLDRSSSIWFVWSMYARKWLILN
jgi:hypothetical protein